jgi:hypothetical protein
MRNINKGDRTSTKKQKIMENQDKLTSLYLQMREFENNKSSLAELKKSLFEKEFDKRDALLILQKELKDFKRIKNTTITSLFYSLIGSKNKKLEKEEKEYSTAKLKFYELADEISIINEQIESIQSKLLESETIEAEFNKLLSIKEKAILNSDNSDKLELVSLNRRILETQSNLKDLNEVFEISERIRRDLDIVDSKLNAIKTQVFLDLLNTNPTLHQGWQSDIDEAKRIITGTQIDLEKLYYELGDIKKFTKNSADLNIKDCLTFTDSFFEGIITNFNVRDKFSSSIKSVKALNDTLKTLESNLRLVLVREKEELVFLDKKRIKAITNYR